MGVRRGAFLLSKTLIILWLSYIEETNKHYFRGKHDNLELGGGLLKHISDTKDFRAIFAEIR